VRLPVRMRHFRTHLGVTDAAGIIQGR
jgi:hypothetical protein